MSLPNAAAATEQVLQEIATELHNIGALWHEAKEYRNAMDYYRQASSVRMAVLKTEHNQDLLLHGALESSSDSFSSSSFDMNQSIQRLSNLQQERRNLQTQLCLLSSSSFNDEMSDTTVKSRQQNAFEKEQIDLFHSVHRHNILQNEESFLWANPLYLDSSQTTDTYSGSGFTLYNIAQICFVKKSYTEALSLIDMAQSIIPSHNHQNSSTSNELNSYLHARLMEKQAQILHRQGDSARALEILRSVISFRNELPSSFLRRGDTTRCMTFMARIYLEIGDAAAARDVCHRALAFQRSIQYHYESQCSSKNSSTTSAARRRREEMAVWGCIYNSGIVMAHCGEYISAIQQCEAFLPFAQNVLGTKRHPAITWILSNLGMMHYENGQTEQAKFYLQEAVSLRRELFGANDEILLNALTQLGHIACLQNQPEEAVRLYRSVLESLKSVYGKDSVQIAPIMCHIGKVHEMQGHLDYALQIIMDALRILRSNVTGGNITEAHANALHIAATIHLEMGSVDDAAKVLSEAQQLPVNDGASAAVLLLQKIILPTAPAA